MNISKAVLSILIVASSLTGGCATRDARMSPSAETTLSAIRHEYARVVNSQAVASSCNEVFALSYNELSRKLNEMEMRLLNGGDVDKHEIVFIRRELGMKNGHLHCCPKRTT